MKREDLEKRLDYGDNFGFVEETGNPDTLGWVILFKRKPAPVTPFEPLQEPEEFLRWQQEMAEMKQRPYYVAIIEQQRAIYEKAEYESTEEFGQKEGRYFGTLDEVAAFLARLGYSLEDIRPAFEIGAP